MTSKETNVIKGLTRGVSVPEIKRVVLYGSMTYQENLMGKIHKVFIISLLTYVLNSKIFI